MKGLVGGPLLVGGLGPWPPCPFPLKSGPAHHRLLLELHGGSICLLCTSCTTTNPQQMIRAIESRLYRTEPAKFEDRSNINQERS